MGTMQMSLSAHTQFEAACRETYAKILENTDDIAANAVSYREETQRTLEVLASQIGTISMLRSEVASKLHNYVGCREESYQRVQRCEAEVSYVMAHPIRETHEDSDGNSHTYTHVDEAALASARSRLEDAEQEYQFYKRKAAYAEEVQNTADAMLEECRTIERGMQTIEEMFSRAIADMEKQTRVLETNTQENLECLKGVEQAAETYLQSRAFEMPTRLD